MTYHLRTISTYGVRRFHRSNSSAVANIRPRRVARTVGVVAICAVLAACSFLNTIRDGWAGTKPFFGVLVSQGVITQAKADLAIRDVDDTLAAADVAERCVNNIRSSGNEKKVAKARCYYDFAQSFRAILARHNIAGSPQMDRIAAIGQGFILALEQYFQRVTGTGPEAAMAGDPDKNLEAAIKRQREDLRAITGK